MPLPTVTLLASIDPLLRERAITSARASDPGLVVVRHELTTLSIDGQVHRRVDDAQDDEDTALPVEAGCCLSCLLRDDTTRVLRMLGGRRVLLVLPPAVEAGNATAALVESGVAELAAIATALDARTLETRLQTTDALSSVEDLGDDTRTLAEVIARLLDHTDVLLHDDAPARAMTLAAALSGMQPQRSVDDPAWMSAGHHDQEAFVARLQAGGPACRGSVRDNGVSQRCWHRRRPLHPQRLLELLEDGRLEGLVRARGWLWVATRPGTVLELDAVGGSYGLGAVDAWLDAVANDSAAHPMRRELATRRWDPYYGDRAQDLALTTLDRDIDEIVDLLDACLLTDDELADGPDGWRSWPDPLAPWLGDEADLLAPDPKDTL